MTGELPKGSILGRTLCNAVYDDILRKHFTVNAALVGYVDDIAVVVTGRYLIDLIELTCKDAIARIQR